MSAGAVAMLLALLLLAHARAEWVEITQLRKPEPAHLADSMDFHEDKSSRPPFSKEHSGLEDNRRAKPQLITEHYDDFYYESRSKAPFATVPNDPYDLKRLKTHSTTEAIDLYDEKSKRLPTQFSTEPGFLADYKRNRIYINHTIDHSSEKYWSKGVVHRVPNPTIGTVKRIYLTTEEPAKVKYEETDLTHELTPGYTVRNPFKTFVDQTPEFVTKEETFEDDGEDELQFVRKPSEDIWANGNEIKPKNYPKSSLIRRVDDEENDPVINKTPAKTPNRDDHNERTTESDAKVNTMENVLKFVKVVADTISKNTRRSLTSKLRYLEDLKETIMINIGDRIESLWPDDIGGAAARRRRWTRSAEARGHVEFPSSESALMTISFLTFAVYLIKLVLQVIQTYKNKTMMVTPAVFAAVGRAANGNRQLSPK